MSALDFSMVPNWWPENSKFEIKHGWGSQVEDVRMWEIRGTISRYPHFCSPHCQLIGRSHMVCGPALNWGKLRPQATVLFVTRNLQKRITKPYTPTSIFIGCRLCRRPLRFDDLMFWWILIGNGGFGLEMEGLVHPQSGLLCGAALPGAFFSRKTWPSWKKQDF